MERIAVLDVQTYTAKLTIANFVQDSFFAVCDVETETIEPGLEIDEDHFIKKSQIASVIEILKNYRKICDMYNVSKTIAVATFVNDTKPMNLYSFFDEIFVTCGFRFTLLDSEEQNSAIYTGIVNSYDITKGFIVDIEPDDIHLIQYNRRTILNEAHIPVGPKTLIKTYPIEKFGKFEALDKVTKFIKEHLEDFDWIKNLDQEFTFIGSGTYFEDLSTMDRIYKKYPLDIDDGFVVKREDVNYITNQVQALELNETKRLKNLNENRADIFAYAMQIIRTILDETPHDEITISTRSTAHGLMFNSVLPLTLEKPNSDLIGFSVMAQTAEYESDSSAHNEQVYNLSMILFKQLKVMHKLPKNYVKILRVASYMHDVGKRISYHHHASHSFEVILRSELFGLTHRELVLVSFVASLHSGGELKMSEWAKYNAILEPDDIDAVKKLGIILRLAECFDRTKNNTIIDINCDILGDSVIMKTVTTSDASFEIQRGMEVYRDFEKYFHKKLSIL